MSKFTFATLSLENLYTYVNLLETELNLEKWNLLRCDSTAREREKINFVQEYLVNHSLQLMNEATLWSRAIYPLLMLSEQGSIQAWSQLSLQAKFPHFEIEGFADGVLGRCVAGKINTPYLVVVEAKRGLEASNPQYQLYGEMLAAAWLNQQHCQAKKQEIFGCYTISDTWTFVQGLVTDFEADRPTLEVNISREYIQRFEMVTIFEILKFIVEKYLHLNRLSLGNG